MQQPQLQPVICPDINPHCQYAIVYMALPGNMVKSSAMGEMFMPNDYVHINGDAWKILNGFAHEATRTRFDFPEIHFYIPCGLHCKECKSFYSVESTQCECGVMFTVYDDFGEQLRTKSVQRAIEIYLPMSGIDIMLTTGKGGADTSSVHLFYKTITKLALKQVNLDYNKIFADRASILTGGMMWFK